MMTCNAVFENVQSSLRLFFTCSDVDIDSQDSHFAASHPAGIEGQKKTLSPYNDTPCGLCSH